MPKQNVLLGHRFVLQLIVWEAKPLLGHILNPEKFLNSKVLGR
jgi:hypothetical protein